MLASAAVEWWLSRTKLVSNVDTVVVTKQSGLLVYIEAIKVSLVPMWHF